MSEALVQVTPQAIQQGGLGVDFSSKLFQLKPATIAINQRMTQAEGAIPGKLRIVESGDQFDEMHLVLLDMPTEARQFYTGEAGTMSRTSDNLMCFSRDLIRPDAKSRVPQALTCATCPKADWTPWRKKKEETGINELKLIPPCEASYRALFIDTVYRMPLVMYIRGGENKTNFEAAMQEIARKIQLMRAQGKNPNLFDLMFTMSVIAGKKKTNYVLKIDPKSIHLITDEQREQCGEVYLNFVNRNRRSVEQVAQAEADDAAEEANNVIEGEIVQPATAPVTGEIPI